MTSVVLLQTAVDNYRRYVFGVLAGELGDEFHVFTGRDYFEATTKTRVSSEPHITLIKNHFLLNRKLLFQTGMWSKALKAEIFVFELNPRILSNWVLLVLRRTLGKKSVLWGHAWPRGGKHQRSDRIRNLMRRLGESIIVYTETQAKELKERMPDKDIIAAPNALYSRSIMGTGHEPRKAKNFIYVGRLVLSKKPMLLLESFADAVESLPTDCDLIYVGDGPLRVILEARSQELGLQTRVKFKGYISEVDKLRELYSTAIASVSPGYVGLSIVQSLGFGVPMIIAQNELHSPEIEAAVEGMNCFMFVSDCRASLSKALLDFEVEKEKWIARRPQIASDCAEHYSLEVMTSRLLKAIGR